MLYGVVLEERAPAACSIGTMLCMTVPTGRMSILPVLPNVESWLFIVVGKYSWTMELCVRDGREQHHQRHQERQEC